MNFLANIAYSELFNSAAAQGNNRESVMHTGTSMLFLYNLLNENPPWKSSGPICLGMPKTEELK